MVWDEENRLRGINDNGRLHLYTYDHTGERALKSSAESSMVVINGLASAVITHTEDYTAYVSPYFVVQKGKFTKHYFEGSSRILSKLGEGTFSQNQPKITAGGLDYLKRTQKEQEARDRYIKGLNTPPGPPTQHGIYATPEWTEQPYPSIDWEAISQNQEPPAGWPRYPKFNAVGDVPGPPVQYGEPVTNANVKAGHGFIPSGVEEKNLYYYHPDHLGSSSYITDKEGQIIQHTEYMAFGETFVDEHSVSNKQPYLFNGKELDFETGLYYYGARYYDPKASIFLNVDPLVEKTGTPYAYTYNNPINLIDVDGLYPKPSEILNKFGIKLNPYAAGFIDGIVDNSPAGAVGFAYDFTTDKAFRQQTIAGIKAFVADPVTSIETIVGNKADTYSAVFNGNGTYAQKYEVGEDVGSLVGTVITGGGIKKVFEKLTTKKGLGNQFKDLSIEQVNNAMEKQVKKGKLEVKFKNEKTGSVSYQNKKSGYSYNVDTGVQKSSNYQKVENAHIDVNYPNPKPKNVPSKKKLEIKD